MSEVNEINRIFINEELGVERVNMTTLAFNNGVLLSKASYSILDNFINVLDPIQNDLAVFVYRNTSNYYEYLLNLTSQNTVVSGTDRFGNTLHDLLNQNCIVFVNGYKLLAGEFTINDDRSITILNKYPNKKISTVIIYTSQSLEYLGNVTDSISWDSENNTFEINDFSISRYVFFINGKLVPHNNFSFDSPKVKLNFPIRNNIDIVEYYRLPAETINLLFAEEVGYLSYGPIDNYQVRVPEIYSAIATFSTHIVRLAIDDIRPGFFIKEVDGDGTLIIIDDDYETKSVKCLEIVPFSKATCGRDEYFIQVPEAKSILKYVSEFDLKGTLFPELLGSFQRTLLDETYDSIQRLKNIRSINKVDSHNINALINFLGVKLNITNMTLVEKHALLEELTNFYNIVGTKASYNFYNVTSKNARIVKLEQLFTPIKDISDGKDPIQRYVTFRTAEELGAKYKREYIYPVVDYGAVGTLANSGDSLSNMPRYEGELEDPTRPPILAGKIIVSETNSDGQTVFFEKPVRPNKYITLPTPGPNVPTIDYGEITDSVPEDFIDYGWVWEEIKGRWIEWFEWDRPANWYPTNHVNVSVEVPAEIDYNAFMEEFKKTFYDISSTVLYIHTIIDVYTFGDDKMWTVGKEPNFGMMTSPLYHTVNHVFTNNPTIKAPILI